MSKRFFFLMLFCLEMLLHYDINYSNGVSVSVFFVGGGLAWARRIVTMSWSDSDHLESWYR